MTLSKVQTLAVQKAKCQATEPKTIFIAHVPKNFYLEYIKKKLLQLKSMKIIALLKKKYEYE